MSDDFARKLAALDRETGLEVFARAKALEANGRDIIHLELGEPDFDTPSNIISAGVNALENGYTHYGPSAGLAEAREGIASFIASDRGVEVGSEHVVITPGGKAIIFFVMMALLEQGDEVIVPDPGYPNYAITAEFLGARPVPLALDAANGFGLDPDALASLVSNKTKLLILNTPHNPTGAVLSRDVLQRILALADRHGFYVLSDEIYSKMVYDGAFTSLLSIDGALERGILLDGHSKTYAMTGWRLGYGVMPPALANAVARINGSVNSCTCSFTQIAGIEALRGPQDSIHNMMKEFRFRRELIVDGLSRIPGIECHRPDGAFYVFPSIRGTGMSSRQAADRLLNDAGVAVLSGSAFGENGEGHIRISFATAADNLHSALQRMSACFGRSSSS